MSEIIVAWAERCSGPGWSNSIIWYLTRDHAGNLSIHDIQPAKMSVTMRALFNTSAVVQQDLLSAVRWWHSSGGYTEGGDDQH